jgi:hypothetical protein
MLEQGMKSSKKGMDPTTDPRRKNAMKRATIKGVAIALASLLVFGCMNPYNDDDETNAAMSGSAGVTIDLSVALGDAVGASAFLSEDPDVERIVVEIERASDGFRLDEVELEQDEVTGAWSTTVTVQTGTIDFFALAYGWEDEVRHFGDAQVVVTADGPNSVTIGTSPIEYLAANVSVSGIPDDWGFYQAFVGLVPAEFDFYTDFVEPFVASGYNPVALDQLAASAFDAAGEAYVEWDDYSQTHVASAHLFNWEGNRPWLETGEHRVFVMLHEGNRMWVPFIVDEVSGDEPFIDTVSFEAPDYSGEVQLWPTDEYREFFEVIAAEGGVSYEVTGIDTTVLPESSEDWELTVAVFPAGVEPFDETGAVVEDSEPVAIGFDWIPAGSDTSGTVVLSRMDSIDLGDRWFNPPWQGESGTYGVYVLLGTDWVYGQRTTYLAGAGSGETFVPARFDFVYNGTVPQLAGPLDLSTQTEPVTFELFDMREENELVTGDAYWELEFEYTDSGVTVYFYDGNAGADERQLSFVINNPLAMDEEIPAGTYSADFGSSPATGTFGSPVILGNRDEDWIDDTPTQWLSYVAASGTFSAEEFEVNVIGASDTITGGTVDVGYDPINEWYTFNWAFSTDTSETLEGSYAGHVDWRTDSTTPQ